MKVLVLNGPNLGRLGKREPEIYGTLTHDELAEKCICWGNELGLEVQVLQFDSEAEIISWILQAGKSETPIILNAAAFTHYSYPIAQACRDSGAVIIEVHISNPHTREEFRHKSVISSAVKGTIAGFGVNSYRLALIELANQVQ